jgi:predicted RNA-binding Zn-ribbon protein involved in translation (DUF1610 family)
MSSFFDAVRGLKYSGTAPKACPVCGSVNIKIRGSLSGWLLPAVYSCEQCGYSGSLVLELEEASEDEEDR